jgi:hypothetical protein
MKIMTREGRDRFASIAKWSWCTTVDMPNLLVDAGKLNISLTE